MDSISISNDTFKMDVENIMIHDKYGKRYKIKSVSDYKCIIIDSNYEMIKKCLLSEIERVCNNKMREIEKTNIKKQLVEYFIRKEEHLIKDGMIVLKNTPLKDDKVYVEFEDNDKILQIDTKGNKEISVPKQYVDYKNTIYCTYKTKDWLDTIEISAGDVSGIALEDIKGCDTY
ncbi:hypothetical protein CF086_17440 [Clostridium botulinum]|uniref:hypothetical protein n=1 Tax=Clostridium botulinum TaxID=1491 RepID=UPI000773F0F3|nr:hypothetical protein [Clostridium botulinum]MBN3352082.1 hypothetical protein [Clostridium botulinum]